MLVKVAVSVVLTMRTLTMFSETAGGPEACGRNWVLRSGFRIQVSPFVSGFGIPRRAKRGGNSKDDNCHMDDLEKQKQCTA